MTPLDILTPDQAAELLGCTPSTVEDALREQRLPGVQYGRGWRIPRQALLQVLNDQALRNVRQAPPEPAGQGQGATRLHVVAPVARQAPRRARGASPAPLPDPPAKR